MLQRIVAIAALLVIFAVPAMASGLGPERSDEGTGAHVFQFSIAALLPVGLLFLATADWARPLTVARRAVFPFVVVLLAFAILHYYERVYVPWR